MSYRGRLNKAYMALNFYFDTEGARFVREERGMEDSKLIGLEDEDFSRQAVLIYI